MKKTIQKMLLVDDEVEIRENLHDFAEFKGFQVFEAGNGLEALHIIETEKPDIVISDFKMPEMNGLEMLVEKSKRDLDVPVVIMTAFGTMEYAIDAMKAGASDFITKPIDLNYLMQVVERVLKRSAMENKIKEQQMQLDIDLNHAATIQQCLLPSEIETSDYALRFRFEPMIAIGGDYLTIQKYSDQEVSAALYDVSGHGVSAALTASLIHSRLQQLLSDRRPPSNVIDILNRFMVKSIGETHMFATGVVMMLDTENETVAVTNAGHPDVYIWHSVEQTLEAIPSHVPPVGFGPKILGICNESQFSVKSGDRLIAYTDGFVETLNAAGEMIGKNGLRDLIQKHSNQNGHDFITSIYDEISSFRDGEADDDLTMMVLDVK
jgi:sigma-B regulation protein RsbU (phosphoserine phosphatase)